MNFCHNMNFSFLNNAKDLNPFYKMDLDFLDCLGRKKLCLITKEMRYFTSCHPAYTKLIHFSKHGLVTELYRYPCKLDIFSLPNCSPDEKDGWMTCE